ncbi:O-Methyltransferase involved in polyketide biosynthesis [Pasteurella testudinis DSM 23072]|uniref:O-Methyltransferase involved in polyketide biosynthesis n=1 Tax=Pasteurella testudinis DSM 23072 TaxID=1122938 RepID=A0A1W1V718_9PAST|nr:class I SAM-dependent methyltransferase [Pasteurella testudinis]SMB89219.1 O-Methyltransferase involved in polyketide biosynthesis [Pasteurella testudinis DSM 23072]SUB52964.1 tetracenomycin polyketide synthesis O-methyltransferase TcmP [Pasteurella testudinis]
MDKLTLNLENHIAETLLITLYAKAVESKRKHPLINDPDACRMAAQLDYDFSKYRNTKASTAGVAIRASHFDHMAAEFIERHARPVVVSVGCGLDTRRQRLGAAGGKAVFYLLDLAEVIAVRAQLLPPADNEILSGVSMLETAWMDDLLSRYPDGDFLFVIEGVLMFFTEADCRFLLVELAKRFDGAQIHFDLPNQWLSRRTSWHDAVSKTNAVFKFGLDNPQEIETWHPHLHHQRTWLFPEFKGWRRMGWGLTLLMSLIPALKHSMQMIAYKVVFAPQNHSRADGHSK